MKDYSVEATIIFLAGHRDLFDRITKNGQGGRVSWSARKPQNYPKDGMPWSIVRGRYFYPWKEEAE